MRYKAKVPTRIDERVQDTRKTCDACGKDVESTGAYDMTEVTVEAKIGDVYPERDHRTVYEVDLCGPCFTTKVIPALTMLGIKVRERDADDDDRVWDEQGKTHQTVLNTIQRWDGGASNPIRDVDSMRKRAGFRSVVFCLSAKTAHVLLDHPHTLRYLEYMRASVTADAALMRQSSKFCIGGLAYFEVVDGLADGTVSMVDQETKREIERLTGVVA